MVRSITVGACAVAMTLTAAVGDVLRVPEEYASIGDAVDAAEDGPRVAELRIFAGLPIDEIASLLGVSRRIVDSTGASHAPHS